MEINSDLIKNNNLILEKHSRIAIRKRLKREIDTMYPFFNEIVVYDKDLQESVKVTVSEFINGKKQKYEFIIDLHYPFVPPKIYFQGKPYMDFLRINYDKNELNLFKKVSGYECLCCHSLNCRDNWSPAITLKKIIEEIYRFKQVKRNVIYKMIINKIKSKYLIDDIDIDSWLF